MKTADILAWVAAGVSVTSLAFSFAIYRLTRRSEAREATTALMTEWWGKELSDLRRFYRSEFAPKYYELVALGTHGEPPSFHEIEQHFDKHRQLRTLCYFFDRVGWLGAEGLVDVDYILAAFQHYVKEVWSDVQPFILKERQPQHNNPVFLSGFEWLHKRSHRPRRDQAHLLRSRFRHPRLLSRGEEALWRQRVIESERSVNRRAARTPDNDKD